MWFTGFLLQTSHARGSGFALSPAATSPSPCLATSTGPVGVLIQPECAGTEEGAKHLSSLCFPASLTPLLHDGSGALCVCAEQPSLLLASFTIPQELDDNKPFPTSEMPVLHPLHAKATSVTSSIVLEFGSMWQ